MAGALLAELGDHEVIATDKRKPADLPAGVRFEEMDIVLVYVFAGSIDEILMG